MLICSILSPAASATLTPHFFCSKVDVVWMRTFGTLLFYLLIYFFPQERDRRGRRDGVVDWPSMPALTFFLPCLVGSVCFFSLYFLILTLFSFCRSSMFGSLCFFLSPRSRSSSAAWSFISSLVSFCPHDHVLSLLHDLLSLLLLIFGILSFPTDSVLITVFHFNTDFHLFLPITLD